MIAPAVLAVLAAGLGAWGLRERSARLRAMHRLSSTQRALERLQRAFARFAPAAVVDDIAAGEAGVVAPEKREVTVLFADLQGFTAMSDKLDPAVLVTILNGYFGAMSAAISAHRGHVSKFIGDGIMALFGAPEPNPWQSRDAVLAALAMREALARYNATLREKGLPELRFGVGLHRGVAVAGVIGSDELVEYTVIGDTVNLASRIESLTRQHGTDVLVTAEVRRHLGDRFVLHEFAPAAVKGKPEPVLTFGVAGAAEPAGAMANPQG